MLGSANGLVMAKLSPDVDDIGDGDLDCAEGEPRRETDRAGETTRSFLAGDDVGAGDGNIERLGDMP